MAGAVGREGDHRAASPASCTAPCADDACKAYYRCRYTDDYAVAATEHPKSVYVKEEAILPGLDRWLASLFDDEHIDATCDALAASQKPDATADAKLAHPRHQLADCDRRIDGYRKVLDEGGDPATVAAWIADTQRQRKVIAAELGHTSRRCRCSPPEVPVRPTTPGAVPAGTIDPGEPGSLVGTSTSERRPDAAPPTAPGRSTVNALGLGLLLVAGLLVLVEVAAPGIGLAGALATATFVIGLAMLVGEGPGPDLNAALAAPALAATIVAATVVARRLARDHGEPSLTSGAGAVIGRETAVRTAPGRAPQGFVAGAWWTLRATGAPLADGDRVLVVGIDGLVLEVEHLPPPEGSPATSRPQPEEKDQ